MSRWPRTLLLVVLPAVVASACLSRGKPLDLRDRDGQDAGLLPVGAPPPAQLDASLPPKPEHSLTGVNPSSGSWQGGLRAIVRGSGFSSKTRVWFADNEVPSADVVPIDPTRLQVIVPAGDPGPVDVQTQNENDDSTRSTLRSGFIYDYFYADPNTGPTSGGTRITLYAKNVDWNDETLVTIDGKNCRVVRLASHPSGRQELQCETPPGSQGSKSIVTLTGDDERYSVLGGFTYSNDADGFRGGLGGDALDDQLTVLVLDGLSGAGLEDASVFLGSSPSASQGTLQTSDSAGLALLEGDLGPLQTVTVAKSCFHPVTFVDVPVDRLTVYLDPVLSPSCVPPFEDPPPVPNTGFVSGASVEGELVWPGTGEFERNDWSNVPPPIGDNEQRVAYLFELTRNPQRSFALPRATLAVTEEDIGPQGFEFRLNTNTVGNLTLYALAGVEDRSQNPPLFQAYAMGLVRGVATEPLGTTRDVLVSMDNPLDQALHFEIDGPKATARGPDRIDVTVAVRIGNEGYAILPDTRRGAPLAVTDSLEVIGLPPLIGSLQSSQYVATARASSGVSELLPESLLGPIASSNAAQTILLGNFVEIPRLVDPAPGADWDGRSLQIDWPSAGSNVDLLLIDVQSAGGLVTWRIVSPSVRHIELPDLSALLPEADLESGSLDVLVSTALLDNFDYGKLAYADLNATAWRASATDLFLLRY